MKRFVTHGAGDEGLGGRRTPQPFVVSVCAVVLALAAGSAHADSRYSLTGAPAGAAGGAAPVLEAPGVADAETVVQGTLSSGLLSQLLALPLLGRSAPETLAPDPDSRYRLSVSSEGGWGPEYDRRSGGGFPSARMFEAAGGYHQELGAGFGYGLNLGLGMEAHPGWSDRGTDTATTSYFTDLSFGPTFASGRLDSQFRIGVRRPLGGDDVSALGFGHGDRHREVGRTAGYLSLDGRLQLQNESELSLSLYYDNYSLNESSTEEWLEDRLEFEGATSDAPSSVIGVEMGLTF